MFINIKKDCHKLYKPLRRLFWALFLSVRVNKQNLSKTQCEKFLAHSHSWGKPERFFFEIRKKTFAFRIVLTVIATSFGQAKSKSFEQEKKTLHIHVT